MHVRFCVCALLGMYNEQSTSSGLVCKFHWRLGQNKGISSLGGALPTRPEWAFGRLRGPKGDVFPKSSSNLLHEAGGRSPGHVSVVTPQRPLRCVQPAAASSAAVNSRCGPAASELGFGHISWTPPQ